MNIQETIYQIYALTDGKEVFQRRLLSDQEAEEKNEAAKVATDFNIWWQPMTEELARLDPIWS